MWEDSDGKTFGHQKIEDVGIKFETDWFNHNTNFWSARINIKDLKPKLLYSFIFYLAIQVLKFFFLTFCL